ncbi:hypothetical protein [Flectobacillus longus]|uniref:hypothetical protein n=1 Tax=Flectobacillus longus TaxID=2984207 RepID=UPI0024B70AB4|nr:hypothetical protein [Flectobacillus longus]MDI9880907.1 hypothetical protein [Flectobacillus longus]
MQSSSTIKSSGGSTAKKSKLLIIGSFIGISLLSCSDAQYQVVDHLLGIETPEKKDTVDIDKADLKLSELDTVPEFGTLDYFDATDTAFARLEEKTPKTHNPSTPPRKQYRRPRDRLSMRSDSEIEKAFEEAKRKIAQMYDSTNH